MYKLIFIFFSIAIISNNYQKIFGDDYLKALDFVEINKDIFKEINYEFECDAEITISVVFPELIRYSLFIDFFETKFLELIYIKKGSNYADFSIGNMQMKASFIEKIENFIKKNDILNEKKISIFDYKFVDLEKIREERIYRLKSFLWQIKYLCVFYKILEYKFKNLYFKNKKEKIRFYASAYNRGFQYDEKEIKKWINRKNFPYGINFLMEQYSYSDISADFYEKFLIPH